MYEQCHLCAHRCGINRNISRGRCGVGAELYVARAALHHWEEPPISGTRGSGTIFFCGCSLGCIYCQNREISRYETGIKISTERLSEIMLELESQGAHNINLVTPTHYIPTIAEAIRGARRAGLSLPIVYNTSSYDTVQTLELMDGLVDIYLPDLKYYRSETADKLSHAENYPKAAREAIAEMYRQVGEPMLDSEGVMKRGVIARILLLPGHLAEAKLSLKYLLDTYGDSIYISLMSQYTPMGDMPSPLDRRVSAAEYRELVEYAEKNGLVNGFVQDGSAAEESFVPPFDNTGVLPENKI